MLKYRLIFGPLMIVGLIAVVVLDSVLDRIDLADTLQRLADSDLSIARFYRKVESQAGFEFHARRALETARDAGNSEQVEEAEALLAEAIEAAP